jgi:archaellum component FlaC
MVGMVDITAPAAKLVIWVRHAGSDGMHAMPVDLTEEFLQDYARLEKENEAWRNGAQKTPALESLQTAHGVLQAKYDEVAAQLRDTQTKATNAQRLLEEETARHHRELDETRAKHAEDTRDWEQRLANADAVTRDLEGALARIRSVPVPAIAYAPVVSGSLPPSDDAAAIIEELQKKVEDLEKEKSDLQGQVDVLAGENNVLAAELSILKASS